MPAGVFLHLNCFDGKFVSTLQETLIVSVETQFGKYIFIGLYALSQCTDQKGDRLSIDTTIESFYFALIAVQLGL